MTDLVNEELEQRLGDNVLILLKKGVGMDSFPAINFILHTCLSSIFMCRVF